MVEWEQQVRAGPALPVVWGIVVEECEGLMPQTAMKGRRECVDGLSRGVCSGSMTA